MANTRKPTADLQYIEDDIAELQRQVADHEARIAALEQGATTPPPDVEQPPVGEDSSLQELVDAGGAVTLPRDSYNEFCTVNKPVQITGQPTTIDVAGLTIANQKGIFDAQKDIEVTDLVLKGAKVNDHNGAAIRGAIGANVRMTDCEITGNEMGILVSGGADIEISNCNFHDNGTGLPSGSMGHEVYCSGENPNQYGETHFTLTDSSVIGGPKTSIALKVRATTTTVRGCEIRGSMNTDPGATGRVVDLCEGGEVLIENSEIELRSTSPTSSILGYMTENTNQGAGTVTLRNVKVIDGRNRGGEFWCRSGAGGKLVLENCTYTAPNPPSLYGWDSVVGQFTKA